MVVLSFMILHLITLEANVYITILQTIYEQLRCESQINCEKTIRQLLFVRLVIELACKTGMERLIAILHLPLTLRPISTAH